MADSGDSATLSVKVPSALGARVDALAKRRRVDRSTLVREALQAYVEAESPHEGSVLELVEDLLEGPAKGPRDLSSNPKHMAGFGK